MKKFLFIILLALLMPVAFSQNVTKETNIRFEHKKKNGYFNITQIGMFMGNRQVAERYPSPYYYSSYPSLSSSLYYPYQYPYHHYYNTRTEMQTSPSLTMTNGYMFNEHWAAGIGVGFEIFDHNYFPVFADVRYTLWDNKISPFFAVKTGYSFGNFKKKHYDNLHLNHEPYYANNVDFRNYGGFMLHPEMGVKVPLSENADLMFTAAYRYQKIKSKVTQKFDYNPHYYHEWEYKASLNSLSFGIAIMFR